MGDARRAFTKAYLAGLKAKATPYNVADAGYAGYEGSLNAKV